VRFGLRGVAVGQLVAILAATPVIWWCTFRMIDQSLPAALLILAPPFVATMIEVFIIIILKNEFSLSPAPGIIIFGGLGGLGFLITIYLLDRTQIGRLFAMLNSSRATSSVESKG
jgi:hypothetical protein